MLYFIFNLLISIAVLVLLWKMCLSVFQVSKYGEKKAWVSQMRLPPNHKSCLHQIGKIVGASEEPPKVVIW